MSDREKTTEQIGQELEELRQEVVMKVKTAKEAEEGARAAYMAVVGTIPNPAVRQSFENIDVLIRKSPEAACYALAQFHATTAALALKVRPEDIEAAVNAEVERLNAGRRED